MEQIKEFTNQGVAMVILGFVLWFLIKPLFQSMIANVDLQTKALQEIIQACKENKEETGAIRKDISDIKNSLIK